MMDNGEASPGCAHGHGTGRSGKSAGRLQEAHNGNAPASSHSSRPAGDDGSLSPLVTKLQCLVQLSSADAAALEGIARNPRHFHAEQILISEGVPLGQLHLIVEGFGYRYKILASGRRQILGYLIPGDVCGLDFADTDKPDHSVALMSDSLIAGISVQELRALRSSRSAVDQAFSAAALVDQAILREWLLNVGQRSAFERLSHFFCEMSVRLGAIGHVNEDGSFDLPLNQVALADTTGLTTVHINRTLQRLRKDGLIELRRHRLMIPDPKRLAAVAGFDEEYLNIMLACR